MFSFSNERGHFAAASQCVARKCQRAQAKTESSDKCSGAQPIQQEFTKKRTGHLGASPKGEPWNTRAKLP